MKWETLPRTFLVQTPRLFALDLITSSALSMKLMHRYPLFSLIFLTLGYNRSPLREKLLAEGAVPVGRIAQVLESQVFKATSSLQAGAQNRATASLRKRDFKNEKHLKGTRQVKGRVPNLPPMRTHPLSPPATASEAPGP